jgi:hypothetical protein
VDCGLRIADCGMRNAECGMRNADCGLRIADCGLRIAESTHGTNRIERVGMDGGGAVTGCFLGE